MDWREIKTSRHGILAVLSVLTPMMRNMDQSTYELIMLWYLGTREDVQQVEATRNVVRILQEARDENEIRSKILRLIDET